MASHNMRTVKIFLQGRRDFILQAAIKVGGKQFQSGLIRGLGGVGVGGGE